MSTATVVREPVKAPPPTEPGSPVIRHRLRLLVGCVLLVTVCFLQDPGLVVADTKLDLALAPLRFLGRALSLWDPSHDLGRIQDQAGGYLFPMGPFFALGHLVGLPAWVVQRLWMATVLVTAFLGSARVGARLGVRGSWPVILGAAFYVESPRALTLLGVDSAEILPWAVLPWALLALMPRSGLIDRRAVSRSALAVVAMGGVNAAAVLATLPVPALWLLTRRWSAAARRVLLGWLLAVAVAVAWWLLPLLLEARYGFGFLGYTESAAATASHNGVGEALRGTSDWVGYLVVSGQPWLRAGWWLSTDALGAVFTAALLAGGAAGLALRRVPHRRFLLLTLLVGTACVCLGHVDGLVPQWAASLNHLLDGPLAPFRNTHKFDPMIRLPLAVGLGHLLSRARIALPGRPVVDGDRLAAMGAAVVLLVVAVPAIQGTLPSRGGFTAVPAYWTQAAAWLDSHAGHSRTLGLPGSGFGEYDWGRPLDEPLGVLAASSTVSRTLIPLGSAGETRVLDAVEDRIRAGIPSPGLAASLRRAGVKFLLVRNDLDRAEVGAPWPVLVHAALDGSPGLRRVATFGPTVGPVFVGPDSLQYSGDAGLDAPFASLEVYAVDGTSGPVDSYPASSALALSGGPESVLQLADAGLLGDRPTVLAADARSALGLRAAVITDGLRRRELNFGLVANNASATLAVGDPFRLTSPEHDYLPVAGESHQTVSQLSDGARVAVSSSASDADVLSFVRGPQFAPSNAFDTDPSSVWLSSPDQQVVGQWARLDLATAIKPTVVALRLASYPGQPRVTGLRIATDKASILVHPASGDAVQVFDLPPAATASLKLTVESVQGPAPIGSVVGLIDVSLPPVAPQRTLVTPSDSPVVGPAAISFAMAPGARGSCVPAAALVICQPLLASPGEETRLDRTFTLRSAERLSLAATAVPRVGDVLAALLATGGSGVTAVAASSTVADPQGSAAAAVDGDVRTSWSAGSDAGALLTLSWPQPQVISSLDFVVPAGLPVSPPEVVHLHSPAGDRDGLVSASGHVILTPLTTRTVTLSFPRSFQRYSAALGQGAVPLTVGFAEVEVDGRHNPSTAPGSPVSLPCGNGPTISVDGRSVQTAVTATIGQLLALQPVSVTACSETADLEPGVHRLTSEPQGAFQVISVSGVPDSGWPVDVAGPSVRLVRWSAETREVRLSGPATSAASYLVVHENYSAGWVAEAGGHVLPAVRIDGWQQGWLVPPGAEVVTMTFSPGSTYSAVLLIGLAGILILLVVALRAVPARSRNGLEPPAPAGRRQVGVELLVALAVLTFLAGPWAFAAVGVALTARLLRGLPLLPGLAAVGAGLTAWVALPTVTAPGSLPTGAGLTLSAVGGYLLLASILVAATRRTEREEEP